jgi:outer membrane protein TolC
MLFTFPAAMLAASLSLAAPEPSLTLSQAQSLAVVHSRQLQGIDAAIGAARDMALVAGQLPDPVLKVGIDNLPVSGADRLSLSNDFMTMRRVGVMQELTRSDKRHWRAEAYARAADKAAAEKSAAIAAIERDTAFAWLERYYAEQMAALIAEQAAQSRLEVTAAESAYRAGRAGLADILAARSALAMFEDSASEAGQRVQNAKSALARWTGMQAVLAGQPALETLRRDPLRGQLPQLAVLARQEEIAHADAKLADAGTRADWSVEVAFQQRGPGFSNMISVGVSVPLQWDRKHRQWRERAAKLALAGQASAEREEAQRARLAETEIMIGEWQNGRERIARYERELLPLAGERTLAILAAYRGGKATLADLLAARRNETEVRLRALQLRLATARTWAQLDTLFPSKDVP